MSYRIETVSKESICREALLTFLLKSPGVVYSEEIWRARLKHWWDDNPVSDESTSLGWVLLHDSQIVGFLGCIPLAYEYQGQPVPAVAATTWRVADAHRGQSLQLFLQLLQLSKRVMVIHSSPIPAVAAILEKSGFQSRKSCIRHYHLMGAVASPLCSIMMRKSSSVEELDSSVRVVSDINQVNSVAATSMHPDQLERKITKSYLKWLLGTPMEKLHFVGCVDTSGKLTSFLILKPDSVKRLPAWFTVDWFTSHKNTNELTALAQTICRKPSLVDDKFRALFWITSSFDDDLWATLPAILRRTAPALYYYKPPSNMKLVNKYFVLAESDYVF